MSLNNILTRRKVLKDGIGIGLASLGSGLFLNGCSNLKLERQPHIIMVTVDTLRSDHLGCYGYPPNTSPNIDLFAKDALLFENCFSHSSITCASVSSILSGFYPHETKVDDNLPLPRQVITISKLLKKAGYKTMAVVSNWILRQECGWSSGFDIYDDTLDELEVVRNMPERGAAGTTRRANELLRANKGQPLFLWVHYQDPHGPYTPSESFGKQFDLQDYNSKKLPFKKILADMEGIPSYQQLGDNDQSGYYMREYDGEIAYMDKGIWRLDEGIEKLNIYDESLIIFSSDHGEGMGEKDYYFAHGENLFRDVIQVPLIIRFGRNRTERITRNVQHIDIVPTILGTIGFKTKIPYRGINLLSTKVPEGRIMFSELLVRNLEERHWFGVLADNMKLTYQPVNEKFELYDIKMDVNESNNLINQGANKNIFRKMKGELKKYMNQDLLALGIENKMYELTDKEVKNLRSLGYLE